MFISDNISLLEWEMFRTKVVEKIEHTFCVQ